MLICLVILPSFKPSLNSVILLFLSVWQQPWNPVFSKSIIHSSFSSWRRLVVIILQIHNHPTDLWLGFWMRRTHLCCEPPAVTGSWRPPCTVSSTAASWPCLPPSLDSTGCWRPRRWNLPKPAAQARPALSCCCCTQGRWRTGEGWVWAWGTRGSPWEGSVGWSEGEGALERVGAHLTGAEAAVHLQKERKMEVNAVNVHRFTV